MKILINGIGGFMGRELARLCQAGREGAQLYGGVDPAAAGAGLFPADVPVWASLDDVPAGADLVVDFSHHSCTQALLSFCIAHNLPLVLATTGQTDAEKQAIQAASAQIPLFFAANYSIGVTLLTRLAVATAAAMPGAEIEIVETHHDRKLDAPSGTALAIANAIKGVRENATFNLGRSGQGKRTPEEIGIHSLRIGNVVGEHEVIIATQNETISLKHQAHSRALFAEGALAAAAYLTDKPAGLYNMNSMISF